MTARSSSPRSFRSRARLEAQRYGPDPWVFVRELLQNARDAGAGRVDFVVEEDAGSSRVECRDDGEGMSFDHARRYLFSLYASSKEQDGSQAGQFGVGFWSVLRFEPSKITIASRPESGSAWALRLDGDLEHAEQTQAPSLRGTQITLERSHSDGMLARRVRDAAVQNARFLRRRDNPEEVLHVAVNGRSINAPFELTAPSACFSRGRIRGVVGLGPAPRVELFSRGLRVRSAASLEDLLAATGHTDRSRVRFSELPGGIAPVALLENDDLELLLARSDARDTRSLRRLVRLANRELANLVERQLSLVRPSRWFLRPFEPIARLFRRSLVLRTMAAAGTGALAALAIAWTWWGELPFATDRASSSVPVAAGREPSAPGPQPYSDLRDRYGGPRVDVLEPGDLEPLAIAYAPPDLRPRFAALLFDQLAEDGSPVTAADAALRSYDGTTCDSDCILVELEVRAAAGTTRIPIPTGHRLVQGSVLLDETPTPVSSSATGQPVLQFTRPTQGLLRYRTAPAASDVLVQAPPGRAPLPPDLRAHAQALRGDEPDEAVEAVIAVVRARVGYDRSPAVSMQHEAAREQGTPFVTRTLAIGKGDCDIQNALLMGMLHEAGIAARLAVGYLGLEGTVAPWLHAWVEYQGSDGYWRIADASDPSRGVALPDLRSVPASSVISSDEIAAVDSSVAGGSPDPQTVVLQHAAVSDDTATGEQPTPIAARAGTANDGVAGPIAAIGWRDTAWLFPPLLAVLWLLRGRTRRSLTLDDSNDLSQLLQGALQQPAVFRHLPALFHRPLVPLLGGGAISLHRARELSLRGQLYRTRSASALARRSQRRAAVLDTRKPEGRTVADAFSATDLDRWDALLARSTTNPLLDAVNTTLRGSGEEVTVRATPDLAEGVLGLDVNALRTSIDGRRGGRIVVVDSLRPWFIEVSNRFETEPRGAVFAVLDRVAERIGVPDMDRAALLAAGARGAVREIVS